MAASANSEQRSLIESLATSENRLGVIQGMSERAEEEGSLLLSLCTFFSFTVVFTTFLYKAPQVYEIIHSGSTAGISLTSVVLEWIAGFKKQQLAFPYQSSYILAFCVMSLNWLPESLMVASIAATTPLLCWSKVDQLVEILWSQDPGSLSALTWFIAVYDTAVVITKDMPMFINLTSSEILNIAIFTSIVYYNYKKDQAGEKPKEWTR
ncbi:P loop repeat-containing protein 3 [Plakobranchus ocellatus]|uniref:P loop repeat-containing protein 3 n=1 Tax=Plakobranchus ocellatus TaxID=259542 RepID=A0AAV4AVC6_9GAST|nr:P loop repeat-containing protein 3 [Plakobranchus ocellatus]